MAVNYKLLEKMDIGWVSILIGRWMVLLIITSLWVVEKDGYHRFVS